MLDFAKEKYHYLLKKQEDAAKSWYEERGKEYLSETSGGVCRTKKASTLRWA